MSKKKPEQVEESAEQQALEQRIDVMMSVELPDKKAPAEPAAPAQKSKAEQPVPVVAEEQLTAPTLPPQLLKTIGTSQVAKTKKAAKAPAAKPATYAEPEPPALSEDGATVPHPDDPPPERILKLHIDRDSQLSELEPPDSNDETEPATSEDRAEALPAGDPLQDSETDKAVDDIVASEADLQLAVDDARVRRRTAETDLENQRGLLAIIFTSPWTWLIIIGTAAVVYAWYH
jgi:hypothetical protein